MHPTDPLRCLFTRALVKGKLWPDILKQEPLGAEKCDLPGVVAVEPCVTRFREEASASTWVAFAWLSMENAWSVD